MPQLEKNVPYAPARLTELTQRIFDQAQGSLLILWEEPPSDVFETRARRRQEEAMMSGARLISELIEPWITRAEVEQIGACVLRLHLYARVLDDAIDEGHFSDRLCCLRAAPILWGVARDLAHDAPLTSRAQDQIIAQVVTANLPNATKHGEEAQRFMRIQRWGTSNVHLLLAPLCLSQDEAFLDQWSAILERCLWLRQAVDEVIEVWPDDETLMIADQLSDVIGHADSDLERLRDYGWDSLAESYLTAAQITLAELKS